MATPRNFAITTTGTVVADADFMQSPFNMSWALEVPAGVTTSYTVNYTLDDLNGTPAPTWFADSVAGTAQTASKTNTYGIGSTTPGPIRGLQLITTTLTGGATRFVMLQGMSSR